MKILKYSIRVNLAGQCSRTVQVIPGVLRTLIRMTLKSLISLLVFSMNLAGEAYDLARILCDGI